MKGSKIKEKGEKVQSLPDTTKQLNRFQLLGFTDNSVWPETEDGLRKTTLCIVYMYPLIYQLLLGK